MTGNWGFIHTVLKDFTETGVCLCFSTNIIRPHPYSNEVKGAHPFSIMSVLFQYAYFSARFARPITEDMKSTLQGSSVCMCLNKNIGEPILIQLK